MQQPDWFESWFGSPYYHILYENRDEQEARNFIENLLTHLKPSLDCRMLDIACGEGRHAVQLAEHGYDVTGIDLSHLSIEKAKTHENEHLHFHVHDMRMPFYINYFNYAFNFFTSFGYFAHDRDHQLAAKSFAAALKKDGILVIDYLNTQQVIDNLVPHDVVHRGNYTFNIKRRVERKHILKEISFVGADQKTKHFTESVAAFTLEDFISIFKIAGLELIETFGDYTLNPYNKDTSPRLVMIFKK